MYRLMRLHNIRCYGLYPGYHDARERILYGSFATLMDHVEYDCAWLLQMESGRVGRRSREDGLSWLNSRISITDPNYKVESANSQIIKDLYLWWTDIRPARIPWYENENGIASEEINDAEDQEMLSKLVLVWIFLWT